MTLNPLLKKHYCPVCEKWIVNTSTQEGVEFYQHDTTKEHPPNIMSIISNTPYWN